MKKYTKKDYEKLFGDAFKCHCIWHKFEKFLYKNFGNKDLEPGQEELFMYKNLHGYECMEKIRKYAKKHPEIKIIGVDDKAYASSIVVLVPHPKHGITMIIVPQCTPNNNVCFLYSNHYLNLIEALKEMKTVYTKSDLKEERCWIKELKK